LNRGDIVLAKLPFSDGSGSKVRPALVVQCDANNQRLEDVIVALITRTTRLASTEPTQLLVDITTVEGKQSRLLHTSAVKCEHLITLDKQLVHRVIGAMPAALMRQINGCLKASLDLP
jgi:mRNA-degrading endonuclease toxin of MazEF toxin-antitoxin module